MGIHLDMLVLEVTRMCNMQCLHCLRGCSQNVYMTKELIDRTFENVSCVNHITFTGGEPFLNLDIIRYTLQVVKEKNIPIFGFYLVTNGKHYENEQLIVLKDWFTYVLECEYGNGWIPKQLDLQESMIGISVSRDDYHEPIPNENYLAYRMLGFYDNLKEHESDGFDAYILDEGNAAINHLGHIKRGYDTIYVEIENSVDYHNPKNNKYLVEEYLYVSANGNICGDCDMSYEHIDKLNEGNLLKNSLEELLLDIYCHQEECEKEIV